MTGSSAEPFGGMGALAILCAGLAGQALAAARRAGRERQGGEGAAWQLILLPVALAAPPACVMLAGIEAASLPASAPYALYAWPVVGAPALAGVVGVGLRGLFGRETSAPDAWACGVALAFGAIAVLTALAGRLGFFEGQALLALGAACAWVLSLRAEQTARQSAQGTNAMDILLLTLATAVACVGAVGAPALGAVWAALAAGWAAVVLCAGRGSARIACVGAGLCWAVGLGLWIVPDGMLDAWRAGRSFSRAGLPAAAGAGQAIRERPSTGGFVLLFPEALILLAAPGACWLAARRRWAGAALALCAILGGVALGAARLRALP